ncbi:MAG TPA: tetratricopeptide repeat protein [Candidatus Angelobacter sp.]
MRHSFSTLSIFCSLLICGLAWAQGAPYGTPDPNEMNQRFENLRAIQRFGRSMDTATMRDTLFMPMPYDIAMYSKVPKKARADFEKGNAALKQGENGKAQELYASAIAEYPEFALAHHNLAVAALNLKDVQRARDEFQAAVKSDPQLTSAYQNLGVLEIQQQNLQGALEPLQAANRLNPTDLKTLTLLAYCQALTHQLDAAVLTARHVHSFKDHTGYAYAHMIAATALQSLGRRDEAIREYKQFLAEDASDPRAAVAKQQIQSLQAPVH